MLGADVVAGRSACVVSAGRIRWGGVGTLGQEEGTVW